jgi:hypothetical protein
MTDGIKRQGGMRGGFFWSYYDDIESGKLSHESRRGSEFDVVSLKMKKKGRLTILSPVQDLAIPEDVDANAVLHILQSRGVRILTEERT